jgi:hypothetical protein
LDLARVDGKCPDIVKLLEERMAADADEVQN